MGNFFQDETLYKQDIEHMTGSSSLVLALSRENAVKRVLDLLGPDDPEQARRLDPFLWRGMHGSTMVANGFYGKLICCILNLKFNILCSDTSF